MLAAQGLPQWVKGEGDDQGPQGKGMKKWEHKSGNAKGPQRSQGEPMDVMTEFSVAQGLQGPSWCKVRETSRGRRVKAWKVGTQKWEHKRAPVGAK